MGIAIVIIFGLAFVGGVAALISVFALAKSNDYGNQEADLERYTGYNPIEIYNAGQVTSSGMNASLFSDSGNSSWF